MVSRKYLSVSIIVILVSVYALYYIRFPNLPQGPITIESNSDFETQGWPGNGTLADPYIISGKTIYSDNYCIKIQDTSVHFVIKNCYLETGHDSIASLWLNNTVNGIIENCEISSSELCVKLDDTFGFIFSKNNIYGLGVRIIGLPFIRSTIIGDGFSVHGGGFGMISENNLHDFRNGGYLWFEETDNMIWFDNRIEGYVIAVDTNDWFVDANIFTNAFLSIDGGSSHSIWNNQFLNTRLNFRASDSSIRNNIFSGRGIYIGGGNNRIENCSISDCSDAGISGGLSNSVITNCTIAGCSEDGIFLQYSSNNEISNCIVRNNTGNGITLLVNDNTNVRRVQSYGNRLSGIALLIGEYIDLINCTIWDNMEHGVSATSPDAYGSDNRVVDCEIFGNVMNGVYYYKNRMGSIIENYIHHNDEWGIQLEECGILMTVTGNTFNNNGLGDTDP